MNRYLDISPRSKGSAGRRQARRRAGVHHHFHGMPIPRTWRPPSRSRASSAGRRGPATIAIIGGRLKAGLTREEIDYLGKTGAGIPRRPAATCLYSSRRGGRRLHRHHHDDDRRHGGHPRVATGGIGGVHRGAQETFDISADLEELADTPLWSSARARNPFWTSD